MSFFISIRKTISLAEWPLVLHYVECVKVWKGLVINHNYILDRLQQIQKLANQSSILMQGVKDVSNRLNYDTSFVKGSVRQAQEFDIQQNLNVQLCIFKLAIRQSVDGVNRYLEIKHCLLKIYGYVLLILIVLKFIKNLLGRIERTRLKFFFGSVSSIFAICIYIISLEPIQLKSNKKTIYSQVVEFHYRYKQVLFISSYQVGMLKIIPTALHAIKIYSYIEA